MWYVSVQDAGRTALVLGPFIEEAACRRWAYSEREEGGDAACHYELSNKLGRLYPWSHFYAMGMVRMRDTYSKEAKMNKYVSVREMNVRNGKGEWWVLL